VIREFHGGNKNEKETEPSVRAVLGHWLFGYIHPYPDGNGHGPFPDECDAGLGAAIRGRSSA
jgi:hypothetical protein